MSAKISHNIAFAWFGIIAIVVLIISWICAISLDSSWIFAENNLSDLSISETDARLYFNYGFCMLTALFLMIFGFASVTYSNNYYTAAGGTLIVIASILLFFIGIITSNFSNGDLHKWFAYGLLLFSFLSIALYSAGFWTNEREIFAAVPTIIMCALVGVYISKGIAGLESWGVIGAIPIIVIVAIDMMLTDIKPRRK